MNDLRLHYTTPEIWFKLQRRKATTEAEMDKLIRIYNTYKDTDMLIKQPFILYLQDGQKINKTVWITGFKTDGENLYTEFMITAKGPKLTQEIR